MEEIIVNNNSGILVFETINKTKLYGKYVPNNTSIGQIIKTFNNNYYINNIGSDRVVLYIKGPNDEHIVLDDLDKKLKIPDIMQRFMLQSDTNIINIFTTIEKSEIHFNPMCEDIKKELKESKMCLFVRTLSGNIRNIKYLPYMTVENLKEQIAEIEGIYPSQQRLIFSGKQLEDNKLMSDYKIKRESTVHLVLRLKGGMYHETSGRNGNFQTLISTYFNIPIDIFDIDIVSDDKVN